VNLSRLLSGGGSKPSGIDPPELSAASAPRRFVPLSGECLAPTRPYPPGGVGERTSGDQALFRSPFSAMMVNRRSRRWANRQGKPPLQPNSSVPAISR
jgi:hypothetical protein